MVYEKLHEISSVYVIDYLYHSKKMKMKKYCFLTVALFITAACYSQSMEEITKLVVLNQNTKAKDALDKFLAEPKNAAKAEAWFYKGRVYDMVSKDSAVSNAAASKLRLDAFDALKKYQQLDPKEPSLKTDKYVWFFDLYNGFFDLGAKEYNAKNYAGALEGFKNALMVQSYIQSKGYEHDGFKFPAVDTSLISNTALAARLAKMDDEAIKYYEKLTALNLNDPDHLEMYQFMVEYYAKAKNKEAFDAIIAKGRQLYPTNDYWLEAELDQVDKNDKAAVFTKYESMITQYPDKHVLRYNYAVELYNYLHSGDNKPSDASAKEAKIEEVITNALKVDNSANMNLLMARHLFNVVYDKQEAYKAVKGAKPEDIKKKAAMKADMLKTADDCLKYADVASGLYAKVEKPSFGDKANLKNAYSIMGSIYGLKGNTAKADEYQKKSTEQ
jgi:hypothetical protein